MFAEFVPCNICKDKTDCAKCELSKPHIFTFYKSKDDSREIICCDCGQRESLCHCEFIEKKLKVG